MSKDSKPAAGVTVRRIDLNAHPKLRASLVKAAKTQKKRAAERAKNQAVKKAGMTRKDYLLAEALRIQFRRSTNRPSLLSTEGDGVYIAACTIANALQRDNPRFNRK